MLIRLKKYVKKIPGIGRALTARRKRLQGFNGSADYWERRYRAGGNSGPGSYHRLAHFKARFLNAFVEQHRIASVVEFGCGDGAQLERARYPKYTGVDISPTAIRLCRARFSADHSKRFLLWDDQMPELMADLSLSLDVIYHLVEDPVFETYMRRLFDSAQRFVIVYSSNVDELSPSSHVRQRQFTRWIEQNRPHWLLESTVKNDFPFDPANPEQTSISDFFVFSSR